MLLFSVKFILILSCIQHWRCACTRAQSKANENYLYFSLLGTHKSCSSGLGNPPELVFGWLLGLGVYREGKEVLCQCHSGFSF